MRICYLADASSIHTQRWVNYFAERGHEVHLISYNPAHIENVKIYVLPNIKNQFLTFILRFFTIKKFIKKIKPDLLHAHYIGGYGWYGALSGFHPFVVSAWGSDVLVDPRKSRISRLLTKCTLNKADLITCDGENTQEEMIKWGESPQKIKIVYHGIGTEIFSPENKDEKVKEVLEIQNSPAVISTRRLDSVYDVESLIKAIPLVLKQISDAKFIIAGEGSEEDYLKDLVESLGIIDGIKFVGQIPHDVLPKYLASSDVYVSTSLSDGGIAISTLEAMACGLTPIITGVGDNRKWIKDGENGFVIPPKDPKSLAEKIVYLLKHEDIRKEFGKRNRKIIEDRNNYYKEMEKMGNIYIELVERYKS